MSRFFADHILGPDTHANLPAAASTPLRALYECTTHSKIYYNDGTAWQTWATLGSAGIVQSVVAGTNVTVDSTDPAHPIVSASGGGGGASPETYDAAVTAALTGVVHRWKFDDASGATVADSVGSLPLTMSGTYTRHVASPTGFGTLFGASAVATSSGLGSVPVANADRCIIVLYRTTSTIAQTLVGYGVGSTRQWWDAAINYGGTFENIGLGVWSDDMSQPARTTVAEIADPTSGVDWHLAAYGYKDSAAATYAYYDGMLNRKILGGSLNTATSGNLRIGQPSTGTAQFAGSVDDVIVMNNWPGKAKLDRLLCAAAGIPNLH